MATYVFERITAAQAASFGANDSLVFTDTSAASLTITGAAATGLNQASITLSSATRSAIFPAATLSSASIANRLTFVDGSALVLGTDAADGTSGAPLSYTGTANPIVYLFGGNDHYAITDSALAPVNAAIHGGDGIDTIVGGFGNDYIYGGASSTVAGSSGADSLLGGDGNDHIYGGDPTLGATATDNADYISGGNGDDYVNGNAGDDTIYGGAGQDRLFGGNGNDLISGGSGNDTVNGNQGADTIDGGIGNDFLRGGQGDDSIVGGDGNDVLIGDVGNDTLVGGDGIDVLTGGDGTDVFVFHTYDARPGSDKIAYDANGNTVVDSSGQAVKLTGFYDSITDFTHGTDKISFDTLGAFNNGSTTTTVVAQIVQAQTGVTFTSATAAQVYAQQLLDANAATSTQHEIAAIQVGTATYLFSHEASQAANATIDSVIRLDGFTAGTLTSSDFTGPGATNIIITST